MNFPTTSHSLLPIYTINQQQKRNETNPPFANLARFAFLLLPSLRSSSQLPSPSSPSTFNHVRRPIPPPSLSSSLPPLYLLPRPRRPAANFLEGIARNRSQANSRGGCSEQGGRRSSYAGTWNSSWGCEFACSHTHSMLRRTICCCRDCRRADLGCVAMSVGCHRSLPITSSLPVLSDTRCSET